MDTTTPQPVTHSSLNRTGLPNILEKFLPKHHTSLQGMKLQIVFNKQVLLPYFLDRHKCLFSPRPSNKEKRRDSHFQSHISSTGNPCFIVGCPLSPVQKKQKKSITLTNRPKTTSDVTPTTLQHKSDKTLPFLL